MGRQRSVFFDSIKDALADVLENCKALGECPVTTNRTLTIHTPAAKSRMQSFRGSTSYKELLDEYGKVFRLRVLDDSRFEISFKEEVPDGAADLHWD